jgi:hypothetical protein
MPEGRFDGFKPRRDISGFTCIPNEWFDKVMPKVTSMSEMKVIEAVFRKTYGWVDYIENGRPVYKTEDALSLTQLENMTGLSRSGAIDGLRKALAHGYIVRTSFGNVGGTAARFKIRNIGEAVDDGALEDEQTPVTVEVEKQADYTVVTGTGEKQPREEFVVSVSSNVWNNYKRKSPSEYNANDLCRYFSTRFEEAIGVKYSRITGKERKLAKDLLDTYGGDACVKSIEHLLAHHTKYIDGHPSISVLYGFRNSLFPDSAKGRTGAPDVRQSPLSPGKDSDKGVNRW